MEGDGDYSNVVTIITPYNPKNMQLNDLFNSRKTAIDFTDGQKQALLKVYRFLQSEENFFLLAGYSGCGKTTLAENIANFMRATMLAPTNAAINRLKEKINNPNLEYSTIHSKLFEAGSPKNSILKEKGLTRGMTYIVDECSMIDKYTLGILIEEAVRKRCKMIFMGDSFQLEPVGEDPNIFNWEKSYPEHFHTHNKYELTEVKRYDGSLLKIATEIRSSKRPIFTQPKESDLTVVQKFSKSLANDIKEGNDYIVLTSTNQRRVEYNEKIRAYLFKDKEITGHAQDGDMLVSVSNTGGYANGEIYSLTNAMLLHQFDITINTRKDKLVQLKALIYRHDGKLTILIPDLIEASLHGSQIVKSITEGDTILSEALRKLLIIEIKSRYGQDSILKFNKDIIIATYGYAISCHKAQGQEWNNVYIDAYWLMPVWNSAKWFYTAITRAKCKVEVTKNKYLKIN